MTQEIFAENFQERPWWWEEAPPGMAPPDGLPDRVDVVVVGAGYTGLSAALTLAKNGSSVLVLEAGDPGQGASTRNGGMAGDRLRFGLGALIKRFGPERAIEMARAGIASVDFIEARIAEEGIECGFSRMGRYYPAAHPVHYEAMAAELETRHRHLGSEEELVSRADQRLELASDGYFGGWRHPRTGGLHPARYHRGLLEAVRRAGAQIAAHTPLTGMARHGDGFRLQTPRGEVRAASALMATNGYTDGAAPYFRRRVIPVESTIIATEELGNERVRELFPTLRMISDSRKLLNYYRPSPDGRRILFGGRPYAFSQPPKERARGLYARMLRIFPQLQGVKTTHVWSGKVAFGFNELPCIGQAGGVHYAMAYTGSGVAMATYLGHKAACRMRGGAEGVTAFDGLSFSARPYYWGWPWFLPLVALGYRFHDRFGR